MYLEQGGDIQGGYIFSLDHTEEVFQESKSRDSVWDCKLIETMRNKGDTVVNPIYEWSDVDIWNYIRENSIETNPLYECGFNRVGCIGCPMASYKEKMKEFDMFPTYKRAYIRTFDKMIETLKAKQKKGSRCKIKWQNGQEVFDWWVQENKYGEIKGQMTLEDME